MAENQAQTKVCSWNEWDPLKHVIVGRADGTMVQAPEPAVERDWPEYGFPLGTYGRLPREMEDKANEQLDNFARILEQRGIRVDRPTPLDFSQAVQTPDWKQASMFGCMPPRDVLLTVGNEILEATMSCRSRWFEYLAYRPLLERYFQEDPDFRWEAAPKPRLTERTYKKDFWRTFNDLTEAEKLERTKARDWVLTEAEPCFDAADVARCGRDLIVQQSTVTNAAGISWLRRHFRNHRVHSVIFKEDAPMHIDATFVPLRPGLALSNRQRKPLTPEMVDLFKKNDWQIVECARPAHDKKAKLSFCSVWLSMNILILDPKTVCVEASEREQMEQFDKLGFEVVPVPLWDVAAFGGGLHCATADVYREGTLEDYFPHQIPGF
ncbi:MAG: serine/threonine protein kinase [Desulfobacterales bacterium]|jgi:glycine amidinotransferase|nr:serine/threonine protein kinase [Desulfobacterales bacterium]